MRKRENWKNQTPYNMVANIAPLLIFWGIFGLVMRIIYTVYEGLYFSTIVMAISSLFLLLSGIIGRKVQEEHEKLNMHFILYLVCVVAYVISIGIMGIEGADFEEGLSGIMLTVVFFLVWSVIIARAYLFKRKGGSGKGDTENEA